MNNAGQLEPSPRFRRPLLTGAARPCAVARRRSSRRNRYCHYGIGQAIIFLSCGFFYLLSIVFLAYSQPLQIGCLPYFHTWFGPSANLGCRSETCCMRLAGNAGRKKSPKIRHLRTIAQICSAISSQLSMSPQYGKLWPNNG